MKARVTENGEITVIQLSGQITYESVDPFRESCRKNLKEKKIIFNLKGLSFVGSTGITPFVNTIADIARLNAQGIKLCHVGSEFKKMIVAQNIDGVEIYEEQAHAEYSFIGESSLMPAVCDEHPSDVSQAVVSPPGQVSAEQPVQAEAPRVIIENRPWEDPSNY